MAGRSERETGPFGYMGMTGGEGLLLRSSADKADAKGSSNDDGNAACEGSEEPDTKVSPTPALDALTSTCRRTSILVADTSK